VASVGTRVGVEGLGRGGTGPGPAGLRSLPAKQHAPKARPSAVMTAAEWPAVTATSRCPSGWVGKGEEFGRTV
jgi:hypothetical protein